jgi:hypothetical protein
MTTILGIPTAAHSCQARRHDEQGRVGGPKAGPQLADEIGVTGGVEERQPHLLPVPGGVIDDGVRGGQRHRPAEPVLDVLVVGHGAAVGDRARPRNGPRAGEQGLGQARLPGPGVTDENDVADF